MNPQLEPNGPGQQFLPVKKTITPSNDSLRYRSSLVLLAQIAVIAIAYFALAKVGLSLAIIHTNVSPVWPPTGLAIAAVVILGYRVWPGILLGALAANAYLTPAPLLTDVAISIGNTVEAVAAAMLLERAGFHRALDRANDVFKFVVVALVCTMMSATIGSLGLCLGGDANWADFGHLWSTWWLGDSVGALVVAPLLLTWFAPLPKRRRLEATFVITLLTMSALANFGGTNPISIRYYPLARLMVPIFLWIAFRLGPRGVSLSNLMLSIAAVWGTSNGLGAFSGRSPNDSLVVLQVFLGTNAVMFLFLVATVEERTYAFRTLSQSQRQMATSLEITRILSDSPDLSAATSRILETICRSLGWEVGGMWIPDQEGKALRCITVWSASPATFNRFVSVTHALVLTEGVGLPGRVWSTLKPAWISDVTKDDNFPRAPVANEHGLHAALAFPIVSGQKLLGVMEFFSHKIRQPDRDMIARFTGIGSQIGHFVERKRAEDERERLLALEYAARSEAEIANRAKDEFLAVVSHELRTPLNAIVGWSSMLKRGHLSEDKFSQAIEIIDRNAKAQTQLIEDILDVSRIISGKFQLDPRPVQLSQVIQAAVEAIRPAADARQIRISTSIESNIGPVAGDAVRLQQVVWNLISNAVKFSSVGGEIMVDVSGDHSEVKIIVADAGEGIPQEFLPLIFERFRQVDSSNSRRHGGLGLGLAIVRHLVELHGGTITAYSGGVGKGSVFTVKLPCAGISADVALRLRSNTEPTVPTTNQLTNFRILSVEDDPDARAMLDTVLKDQGAEVISVSSVLEALEVLSNKESLPKVLISDLGMPVNDGYDLIREVRSRTSDLGGEIPAIAVSGYAANEDIQRALSAGYQVHLKKPVNSEELIESIRKLGKQE